MNSKVELTGSINLGNLCEFTIRELAEKVVISSVSKSDIIYELLPQDVPTQRQPDISLAKNEPGWEPKISFNDGPNTDSGTFPKTG